MTKEELWESVLAQLQFKVSKANFAAWLENIRIAEQTEERISIAVPNTFSREWLSKKYHRLILEVLREIAPGIKKVEYIIEKESAPASRGTKPPNRIASGDEGQPAFEELSVNPQTNLNPRYTFQRFVTASFNELAQASAWAVATSPGKAFNPLLIYGGVGLGKTHLLQAIGNKAESKSQVKTQYLPAGKLVSSIVSSIRNSNIEELKHRFYNLDLLIVDDVQFLAGKEKTQEEFFHIFNTLYENNKQIVLSSDRPPSAIATLEKRLKSRFEGGMVADISQPDYESRLAILESKIQGLEVGDEILSYVANNIQHNIRELEGALNRIRAYQKLHTEALTVSQVKVLLKDLTGEPRKTTTPKKIFSCVAKFYNLPPDQLFAATRRQEIAWARQVAMYFLRKELRKSFPNIGATFGGRDHTTALYACNKIEKQITDNEQIAGEINLIRQRIYSE